MINKTKDRRMKNNIVFFLSSVILVPLLYSACECVQWQACKKYKKCGTACWNTCVNRKKIKKQRTKPIDKRVIETCFDKCYPGFNKSCPYAILERTCDDRCSNRAKVSKKHK